MTFGTETQTPMSWQLFLVDRDLDNDEIASTFAEIFEIVQDDVLVIEEQDDISENLPENIQLVCERSPVKGDFHIAISIYLPESNSEDIANEVGGELEIISRFSEILQCDCLIIDPARENLEDEDACILIQGSEGSIQEVYLDIDRLETYEEYIYTFSSVNNNFSCFPLDIIIENNISPDETRLLLSQIFSIPQDDVIVTNTIDKYGNIAEHIKILCELFSKTGDFKTYISLHPNDSRIEQLFEEWGDEEISRNICMTLHCKCLIVNPATGDESAWLLVEEGKSLQSIFLNSEMMNQGNYSILTAKGENNFT